MTLETLDRTIFEKLRLKTVELGYLPDIANLSGTQAQKEAAYLAAKAGIKNGGKEVIEIKSVGTGQERGALEMNTIIIDRVSLLNGQIGGFGVVEFGQNQDGSFTKYTLPDSSSDVAYQIRTFSKSTKYNRIMSSIIFSSFGKRRFLKTVNSSMEFEGDAVFLLFNGGVEVSTTDVKEWMYTIAVQDVWLDEPEILDAQVPYISTAKLCLFMNGAGQESAGFDFSASDFSNDFDNAEGLNTQPTADVELIIN